MPSFAEIILDYVTGVRVRWLDRLYLNAYVRRLRAWWIPGAVRRPEDHLAGPLQADHRAVRLARQGGRVTRGGAYEANRAGLACEGHRLGPATADDLHAEGRIPNVLTPDPTSCAASLYSP